MKPLLAVFAYPDDEAFRTAGKIALEAKRRDVYLNSIPRNYICCKQTVNKMKTIKNLYYSCILESTRKNRVKK